MMVFTKVLIIFTVVSMAVKTAIRISLLKNNITRIFFIFQNEFNSSEESLEEAIKIGTPLNKRTNNDSLSAALILKNFYDEQLKKPSDK